MTKTLNRREAALALAGGMVGAAALVAATPASAEPQPAMTSALANLNRALADLQLATPDKGGHRVKALGLVNSAIAERPAGIGTDNRR